MEVGSSARMTCGFDGERAGDRDALALPAGELVRVGVEHVGVQPDSGHEFFQPFLQCVLPGRPLLPCIARERRRKCSTRWTGLSEPKGSWKTICTLRTVGRRCLAAVAFEDVDAVDEDVAGGGFLEPGDAAGDGALAAAGLADECHDFAAVDGRGRRRCRARTDAAGEQPADWKSLVSPRTSRVGGVALGASAAMSGRWTAWLIRCCSFKRGFGASASTGATEVAGRTPRRRSGMIGGTARRRPGR